MIRLFVLTLVGLAVVVTSASASMPVGNATASATPQTAGVRPAGLRVSLSLDLRCGKPGPDAIIVTVPRAWRVPKRVARRAVWIDSAHPKTVLVSKHTLTLQPVAPDGTCTIFGPGTIKLKFTRAAKLGNPRQPGRYTVRASIGDQDFSARVKIAAG